MKILSWLLLLAILVLNAPVVTAADAPAAVKKHPQDPLDGPPIVTCKHWVIGDGKTGKVLWGANEAEATKGASTAKMMNAFVVIQLAKQDPKVMDEIVTFSKTAE